MDPTSLIKSIAAGKVKMVEPVIIPASEARAPEGVPDVLPSLMEFLPVLLALQSSQNVLTAAPTFVPRTFQDQIQFVTTGGSSYLYLYFGGAWHRITTT
jgi:hypothetical protein